MRKYFSSQYFSLHRYFTWNLAAFPHPLEMIRNFTAKGRHLTLIIDPHIKRSESYSIHNDCTKLGYYTKNRDGKDYEGRCWPGASSYPDLFNPVVRKYFADRYSLENFHNTTSDVMIWNDMNEPSVFNGPESTLPKDNIHYGGFEHRDVHNQYGFMQVASTFDGLTRRNEGKQRPFILTRSHFAGSQRYAAIWTGDNTANWGHLAASIKMCLSEAVAGFSFCGADVGGFIGNPDPELFERWYQAGAFQPFFRAHSCSNSNRREPWLMPKSTKLIIRDAIRKRYSYLPLWYTLFYEHERIGYPVMRPLFAHYPKDAEAFSIDNEYLLGDRLLVCPVLQPFANYRNVYFPTKNAGKDGDLWYDIDDLSVIDSVGFVKVKVDRYKIPVYQRGGTIVSKKETIRQVSTLMINDPYTIVVCLDKNKTAKGTLYLDDEKSYDYRDGEYIYSKMVFKNDTLICKFVDSHLLLKSVDAPFTTMAWVERVIIAGLDPEKIPKSATVMTAFRSGELDIDVTKKTNTSISLKTSIGITRIWKIRLNY